jgi:hypothetical protein
MGFKKLFLIGIGVGLLVFSVPRYFSLKNDISVLAQVASWEEVQATVKSFKVITQTQNSRWWFLTYPPKGTEIVADYSYHYKGVAYTSSRIWPCPPVDGDVSQLESRLKTMADLWSGRMTCFINPMSPEESFLTREIYKPRLQGQSKIFGVGIILGVVCSVLPFLFWRKKQEAGFDRGTVGHWAKPSLIALLSENVTAFAFLLFGGFVSFNIFQLPDGMQTKDISSWVRLGISFILFIMAAVYGLKIVFPWIRGRCCRLKLSAPAYKLCEPIRMTLCVGDPLPEGGEAVVTLRCLRHRMEDERGSGKMHVTLFESKKCVSCPVWPGHGGDLEIPVEFLIEEERTLWVRENARRKIVSWMVLIRINTPQASYERGFELPIQI